MSMWERCGNCRFWVLGPPIPNYGMLPPTDPGEGGPRRVEMPGLPGCHRHPPQRYEEETTEVRWILTRKDDWCGEWAGRLGSDTTGFGQGEEPS